MEILELKRAIFERKFTGWTRENGDDRKESENLLNDH